VFDRDEQEISQIIETGLESILTGAATLEQVLAEHPGQAEEIRGELEGALWLISRRQEVEARPGFVAASRKRVIERIKAEANGQSARRSFFGFAWPQRLAYQWIVTIIVAMILLTGTGSMLTVSQNSLPGEDLYSVKRAAEQMAYTVTLDNVDRVELSAQFTDRRLAEAKMLIDKGQYTSVESTLQDYEQGITQTLALLNQVSGQSSSEVEEVAANVKQNFDQNGRELKAIADQVPMNVRVKNRVRRAEMVSRDGAAMANTVYQKIQDNKQNPAAAATDTIPPAPPPPPSPTPVPKTATAAPTPKPTLIRIPPTAVPPTREPKANTPAPTHTPVPTTAPTDTPVPAPTNTPLPPPTATDAPTHTPAPTTAPAATAPPAATLEPTLMPQAQTPDIPAPTGTPQVAPIEGSAGTGVTPTGQSAPTGP